MGGGERHQFFANAKKALTSYVLVYLCRKLVNMITQRIVTPGTQNLDIIYIWLSCVNHGFYIFFLFYSVW